ncbi:MAG: hypothetical protein HY461_02205 [Parcubacteria group bacterium]|nr:hypothetical protein [Parcubacteria group bacterium]
MKEEDVLISGDQNVFWDVLLKLAVLRSLGRRVRHDVHSVDFFSRGREVAGGGFDLTAESCKVDGNVNRWTATLEAAPFFGSVVLPLAEFTGQGVNLDRLKHYDHATNAAVVERLTQGDWLGISGGTPNGVAEDTVINKALADAFSLFHSRLFKDIRAMVFSFLPQGQVREAEQQFASLFCLRAFIGQTVGDAYRGILAQNLVGGGPNVPIDSTLNLFTLAGGAPRSHLFSLFMENESSARAAYNEAVAGEGEAVRPLEGGELPFYALVRANADGLLRRVDLCSGSNEGVEPMLRRAIGDGELVAVLGKAIPFNLDMRMIGPVVLPEGGSVYSPRAVKFAQLLGRVLGRDLLLHPVHRLRFHALDALADVPARFGLPDYLQEAFGVETITGQEFAGRWRDVVAQANQAIAALSGPIAGLADERVQEWFAADELRRIMQAVHSQGSDMHEKLRSLFKQPFAADPKERGREKTARQKERMGLERRHEKESVERLKEFLVGMVEARRADLLRGHLRVARSLPYYDNRPFWHWVVAVPGWQEAIVKRAELVRETEADLSAPC